METAGAEAIIKNVFVLDKLIGRIREEKGLSGMTGKW